MDYKLSMLEVAGQLKTFDSQGRPLAAVNTADSPEYEEDAKTHLLMASLWALNARNTAGDDVRLLCQPCMPEGPSLDVDESSVRQMRETLARTGRVPSLSLEELAPILRTKPKALKKRIERKELKAFMGQDLEPRVMVEDLSEAIQEKALRKIGV